MIVLTHIIKAEFDPLDNLKLIAEDLIKTCAEIGEDWEQETKDILVKTADNLIKLAEKVDKEVALEILRKKD